MTRRSVYEPELMDRIEDLALQGLNSARIQAILSGEFGESNAPSIKAVERQVKSLRVQTGSCARAKVRR